MLIKESLEDLYTNKYWTLKQIGDFFKIKDSTVLWWMKKYNIPRRSKSEAGKGKTKSEEHKQHLKESSAIRWSRREEHEKTSRKTKEAMSDPIFRVKFLEAQKNRRPKKFFNPVWSEESRKKVNAYREGKTYKEIYGLKKSLEIKNKQSKIRIGKKTGPLSNETKQKISITKKSQNRKLTEEEKNLKSLQFKHYWANLENRKMQSDRLKGKSKTEEHRKNLSKSFSLERRKKVSEKSLFRIQNNMGSFKDTKPELKMKEILTSLNIPFEHQFRLGNHLYDFHVLNTNILIEVDGDYWHGNSKKFSNLHERQVKQKEKDLKNERLAKENNFILLRFWEFDILNNTEEVKNILNKFIWR